MHLLNNIKFNVSIQRTIGETQYPAGWFLDPAEREKIGVIEVADIPQPDSALYDSTENPDGTWTSTPREPLTVEQIRAQLQPLSAWQVRKVLTQFNLRTKVETAISNADQVTKDAWEYAGEFSRDDALLNSLCASLFLTNEQVDELFTVGITL
jgi:hypothetical protein